MLEMARAVATALAVLLSTSLPLQPAAADTVSVSGSQALLDAMRNASVDLILLASNISLDPRIWTIGAVRLAR